MVALADFGEAEGAVETQRDIVAGNQVYLGADQRPVGRIKRSGPAVQGLAISSSLRAGLYHDSIDIEERTVDLVTEPAVVLAGIRASGPLQQDQETAQPVVVIVYPDEGLGLAAKPGEIAKIEVVDSGNRVGLVGGY